MKLCRIKINLLKGKGCLIPMVQEVMEIMFVAAVIFVVPFLVMKIGNALKFE